MIRFAVGCMQFCLRLKGPIKLEAQDYADKIERTLASLPHVDRASIRSEFDHNLSTGAVNLDPAQLEKPEDGEEGFPLPTFYRLWFSLSIPERVQHELTNKYHSHPVTLPQPLRVCLQDTFTHPVLFVRVDGAGDNWDPTDAVLLLREYLVRELKVVGDDVYLDVLGPTPMQADFAIRAADLKDESFNKEGFCSKVTISRAYDEVEIGYRRSSFSTDDEAYEDLLWHLPDDIQKYYRICAISAREFRRWPQIQSLYNEITESLSGKGLIAELLGLTTLTRKLQQLFLLLTDFRAMQLSHDEQVQSALSESKHVDSYLQPLLDQEGDDRPKFPVLEYLSFVEFLERRLMKRWEVTILGLAALVGTLLANALTNALK